MPADVEKSFSNQKQQIRLEQCQSTTAAAAAAWECRPMYAFSFTHHHSMSLDAFIVMLKNNSLRFVSGWHCLYRCVCVYVNRIKETITKQNFSNSKGVFKSEPCREMWTKKLRDSRRLSSLQSKHTCCNLLLFKLLQMMYLEIKFVLVSHGCRTKNLTSYTRFLCS